MKITQLPILLVLLISPLLCTSVIVLDEIVEDFNDYLGIFNQTCPGVIPLYRALYSNSELPRPNGSNDYFMSSERAGCSQTMLYKSYYETELEIFLYRIKEPRAIIYVQIVNESDNIIHNTTIDLDELYNWNVINVTFVTSELFRIRILYETQLYNVIAFGVDKVAINLHFEVTNAPITDSPTTDLPENITSCVKDDFGINSPGLLGEFCDTAGFSHFTVMQYSNWPNFSKPLNSANDKFLTSYDKTLPSCTTSARPLRVMKNSELKFSIYTDNDDNLKNNAFVFVVNASSPNTILQLSIIPIDSSRTWRNVAVLIQHDGDILLKFQSEALHSRRAFLAIDYVSVKDPGAEDCISTCQCFRSSSPEAYIAIVDEHRISRFGTTSIIVSTAVVVSLLWGAVFTAFIYTKNRKSRQGLLNNEVQPAKGKEF